MQGMPAVLSLWRRHRNSLAAAVALACITLLIQGQGWLQRWDSAYFDVELALHARPAAPEIVIIAIDEYSLGKLGRWPWPRRLHAQLLDRLRSEGVKAAALDIIFSEPDQNDLDGDRLLAAAMQRSQRAVLPILAELPQAGGALAPTRPLPLLAAAAANLGHADIEIGKDGVARSIFLEAGTQNERWPAFALAALQTAYGPNLPDRLAKIRFTRTAPYSKHWQRAQQIFVSFTGANNAFRQVSYADVLQNKLDPDSLRDKIVLVGVTASGLAPTFATPDNQHTRLIPGVEFQANAADTLLNGLEIRPVPSWFAYGLSFLLIFVAVSSYSFLNPWQGVVATLIFLALSVAVSAGLFKFGQFWFSPGPAVFMLLLSYPLWSWRGLEKLARSLFKERQFAQATLRAIGDAVVTTTLDGKIDYMNPLAEKLCGYSLSHALNQPLDSIFPLTDDIHKLTSPYGEMRQQLQIGRVAQTHMPRFLRDPAGNEYAIRVTANPIVDRKGRVTGLVFAFNDVSQLLRLTREMAYLANYDPLTNLVNRSMLHSRLNQAIVHASRSGGFLAILFIDLDGFKKVNDGLGHEIGDQVLKEVGNRLSSGIRQIDTAARWGGDEFILLLEQLPNEEAVTHITIKILERLTQPFYAGGHELFITPSIGISLFPKDGLTGEALLIRADTAMYRVKESGRNNFNFFSQGLNEWAKERLELEREMHHALKENSFQVYYQPQIDLKTRRIVRAEALLRWNHHAKGQISPLHFIPLAEEIGLINPMSEWVLHSVCEQLRQWRRDGLPELGVAINISARQFTQQNLCQLLQQSLDLYQLPADALQVEITESIMMKDVNYAIIMLRKIKDMGLSISIDDFGTGYSSLSYLKQFPVDELKIDRSFVRHITTNPDDASITQAIIALAHNMRMSVIAEGVETRSQVAFLAENHCDLIQGYYFSKPLDASAMTGLLRRSQGIMKKAS